MFLCPERRLLHSSHYSEIHFSLQWDLFLTIVGFISHYSETTNEAAVLAERTGVLRAGAPVSVHTPGGLFKQAQTLYFLNTMRVRGRNWNKSITFTPGKKKNIDKQWKRNKIWRHA